MSMATSPGSCRSCSGMARIGWCSNGEVTVMSDPVGLAPVISRGAHLAASPRLSIGPLRFPGDLSFSCLTGLRLLCLSCVSSARSSRACRPPADGARTEHHNDLGTLGRSFPFFSGAALHCAPSCLHASAPWPFPLTAQRATAALSVLRGGRKKRGQTHLIFRRNP